MKTYTCDKCGNRIEHYSELRHLVKIPERKYTNGIISQIGGKRDFCDACMVELIDWITGIQE